MGLKERAEETRRVPRIGSGPERPLTCVGGRRLLALEAHRGAPPPAPLPADPALLKGPVRRGGVGGCRRQ